MFLTVLSNWMIFFSVVSEADSATLHQCKASANISDYIRIRLAKWPI